MDDNPFAEERWQVDLAQVLEEHELDQLSGVNSNMLAELLALVAGGVVKLVNVRDRGMPEALSAVERAELAALRKVVSLQSVTIAVEQRKVEDLTTLLADARRQLDRGEQQG